MINTGQLPAIVRSRPDTTFPYMLEIPRSHGDNILISLALPRVGSLINENSGLTPCLGHSAPIENIGVSSAPPKPSGPPEKAIAAQLGEAGGDKANMKEPGGYLLAERYSFACLDAIANMVDPLAVDPDALAELVDLADAFTFGEALA